MQNMSQNGLSVGKLGGVSLSGIHGNSTNMYVSSNGQQTVMPDNFIFEEVDPSLDDDDSDSDGTGLSQLGHAGQFQQGLSNNGLKPGKKTKGRVKIKMEFIQNKLRRYTTFSKRKTGIMKKAYELSTLTGTQVMLLVASETGHVYTFATRKLQPMITSDSGKALIQTCLNSPDPPPGTNAATALDSRMKPTGFEETDLSCVLGEEEKSSEGSFTTAVLKPLATSPTPSVPVFPTPTLVALDRPAPGGTKPQGQTVQQISLSSRLAEIAQGTHSLEPAVLNLDTSSSPREQQQWLIARSSPSSSRAAATASISSSSTVTATASGLPGNAVQIPLLLPQGAISMLQSSSQPSIPNHSQSSSQPHQTHLSIAQPTFASNSKPTLSQVVSALNNQIISSTSTQNNQTGELNTPLPASTPSAINIMQGMTPGIVMYHTPQGIVYATPTQNLQDRTIFNFNMSHAEQTSGQQQIITIPVPVSLSGTPLLQLAQPPSVESSSGDGQHSPSKKVKK